MTSELLRAARGLAAIVALGLGAATPQAQPAGTDPLASLSADERAAADSIRASSIMPTIRFLASNGLEGREAGERGLEIAADYLVSRYQSAGLEPGTKAGFEQPFDLRWRVLAPEAELSLERTVGGSLERRRFELRRDWMPLSFSEEGEVEAPVVFAGYGISAPEAGWDDWAALGPAGARGSIVVVLRHEPDEAGEADAKWFEGREMSLHASIRQKAREARAHGAIGLLLVDDPLHHEVLENPSSSASSWRIPSEEDRALPSEDAIWRRGRPDLRDDQAPVGVLGALVSQRLLTWLDADRDWKELQRGMDAARRPATLRFPAVKARLVHRAQAQHRRTANVIAMLRGSDPELSKEYVLVGGHYDHVGKDEDSGDIYNGADDNASGTAAVLAVAEAFARMATPPKRSLIFAAWAAEEKGLLGSRHFVHHPPVELERIVAAINLDMVGRNDPKRMSVVGRTEVPDLVALFDRFAPAAGFALNDDAGAGASRSDNASLWLAGIPCASLFSGTHEDYHQPGDTAGKVVASKVEGAARLSFLVANEIAQGRATPAPLKVPEGAWEPLAPESRRVGAAATAATPRKKRGRT